MSEQQQVKQAKEGGINIITLLIAQVMLIEAILSERNFLVLLLSGFGVLYFFFKAMSIDAFSLVRSTLIKYFKYKKIHHYFSHCKNHKQQDLQEKFAQQNNYQIEKLFQNVDLRKAGAKGSKKLFIYKKKNQFQHKATRQSSFQRYPKTQQYLRARDAYKKTINELEAKGLKQKWFEEFCELVKSNYTNKVKQLLKMSKQNFQSIKSTLQENFEVKIVTNFNKIPQKLEPVHIDEAIGRIALIYKTNCLPWAEKMKKQDESTNTQRDLVQLVEERRRIDKILCSEFEMLQKDRVKICTRIFYQLQEKLAGRQLFNILVEIYNENVQVQEYKLLWAKTKSSKGGITIVESYVSGNLHLDIKVNRQGKDIFYRAKPGEGNPWSFISLAAQLYRLKL